MSRLRVHGTLRDRPPLRDRVRTWLWLITAALILAGATYGTWHH